MRRTIENNQLFRLRRFFLVFLNSWETRSIFIRIVARYDVQGRGLEFVGSAIRMSAEKYDAINFSRPRRDGSIASGTMSVRRLRN